MFNIFINDLAVELDNIKLGLKLGGTHICKLLYADDMVLLSDSEEKLQMMLNHIHTWCTKWHISINDVKGGVVQFRRKYKIRSKHIFRIGSKVI